MARKDVDIDYLPDAVSADCRHERSYGEWSPTALLHRSRVRAILRLIRALELPESAALADVGCANGFVLEQIRSSAAVPSATTLFGLDARQRWLELAEMKGIPNTRFGTLDLNELSDDWKESFDVVTCFETLEHVGNFRNGLRNLHNICMPGGWLLISVPNETGLEGVAKYLLRKILRRSPYARFFEGRSEWPYFRALLSGADLEAFRTPARDLWGPHLGFDIRRFEEFLDCELVATGKLSLVRRVRPGLGLGRMYLLRRTA